MSIHWSHISSVIIDWFTFFFSIHLCMCIYVEIFVYEWYFLLFALIYLFYKAHSTTSYMILYIWIVYINGMTLMWAAHLCLNKGLPTTVETLYSTIYHRKYFIELNIDKFTQYVALWTHKRHPIPRPFGRAMECLLWVLQQKLIVL